MSASMLGGQQLCSNHCRNHAAFVDARPATARNNTVSVQRRQIIANTSEKSSEQVRDMAIAGIGNMNILPGMLMPSKSSFPEAFCEAK